MCPNTQRPSCLFHHLLSLCAMSSKSQINFNISFYDYDPLHNEKRTEIYLYIIYIFIVNLEGCLLQFPIILGIERNLQEFLLHPSIHPTDRNLLIFLYLISHIISIFNSLQDTYESNQEKNFLLLGFCFAFHFHGTRPRGLEMRVYIQTGNSLYILSFSWNGDLISAKMFFNKIIEHKDFYPFIVEFMFVHTFNASEGIESNRCQS